jgi:hypothetical protein
MTSPALSQAKEKLEEGLDRANTQLTTAGKHKLTTNQRTLLDCTKTLVAALTDAFDDERYGDIHKEIENWGMVTLRASTRLSWAAP